MSTQVFVSPGVYTSEKDLTFVTRQVGVTSLGLVGETTIGPAFQPIFIENYGQFTSFFGGLNNTLVKDTGAPLYELPYIAKSYLSQANQLFVTRVLGLSGYDAGLGWAITMDAAVDPATVFQTIAPTSTPTLITFVATGGILSSVASSQPLIQALITDGTLNSALAFLATAGAGATTNVSTVYKKTGSSFSGVSFSLAVTTTGSTSGVTTYFSGSSYSNVDNQVVALIRSRGKVSVSTQTPTFEVTGATGLAFANATSVATNPLATFTLSGVSTAQGTFGYDVSMDMTKKNYLPKVLGRTAQDGKTAIFVEEMYTSLFSSLNALGQVRGLKTTIINYNTNFNGYKSEYRSAMTPYIVSELRGNKVLRLFRFITISDGNAANEQFKISIANIKPDSKEFDVVVRSYYDTDASPNVLEIFSRCTMDPTSDRFIGRLIGTIDDTYASKSNYVLVDLDDTSDTSDAFPAGFVGYPIRDYTLNGNTSVVSPDLLYKTAYNVFDNKRKYYLGLSDTVGIDTDLFEYKGTPNTPTVNQWTGLTSGFHMDIDASGVTIDNVSVPINNTGGTYSPIYLFETGDSTFRTDADLVGGSYEKLYARKFTFAPYGGFDGWDIYRTRRSNLDTFTINGTNGSAGLTSGAFANRTVSNGDRGINSDYYAYLEGIYTFNNPEGANINVFATPGIDTFDNTNLVEAAIEMVEEDRSDSLYIATTPDTDGSGNILEIGDVTDTLDGQFDSSYSATFWPWIQINDAENNCNIYIPPTRDVVRNIALTDNISFPWFAAAGLQRGTVDGIKARVKLTASQRNDLYAARVNPVNSSTSDGLYIIGNKTLQIRESATDRINVRRLLLQTRKLISAVAVRLLFEQNDSVVRNQFLSLVNPILSNIRTSRGLADFRVDLSNSPEDYDRKEMNGTIYLKPTNALEFINLSFTIANTGASFDNI
jgi:hypothetical protein